LRAASVFLRVRAFAGRARVSVMAGEGSAGAPSFVLGQVDGHGLTLVARATDQIKNNRTSFINTEIILEVRCFASY